MEQKIFESWNPEQGKQKVQKMKKILCIAVPCCFVLLYVVCTALDKQMHSYSSNAETMQMAYTLLALVLGIIAVGGLVLLIALEPLRKKSDAMDRITLYAEHIEFQKNGQPYSFPLVQVNSLTLTEKGVCIFTVNGSYTLEQITLTPQQRNDVVSLFLSAKQACTKA